MSLRNLIIISVLLICGACNSDSTESPEHWQQLFNGRDLNNWTPKFTGLKAGENLLETFRVENGMLTVSYENWDSLGDRFGHLFYNQPFSSYKLRAVYRFAGDQVAGGPDWAYANNGLMLHCQPPSTMSVDQDFPLSLEFQLLGQRDPGKERPCGNLCTPGTNVFVDGQLRSDHCLENYSGPTLSLDEWVTAEAVVYGDSAIHHLINGDTVLSYTSPVVGGGLKGLDTVMYKAGTSVGEGLISIQAESHGIEFRQIELLDLTRPE